MFKIKNAYALFLLTLLGFIWGSGYSLAKYAMTHAVEPLGYAFWQSLGPALLLSLITLLSPHAYRLEKKHLRFFLISGLIGITIPNSNMYFIAPHLPAGILAVLVNTVPLIVYPLALASHTEKPDILRLFALIIGTIGIIMIIGLPNDSHLFSLWSLIALISPLAFASCSIYIARAQPDNLNNLQAARGMLVASVLLLTPLVFQQQAFYPLNDLGNRTQQVVILEIILSTLGYLIFFKLIRLAGPVFYSLTGGIVALTGLFWGYILFNEQPSLIQSIAAGCIIFSVFLMSWRQSNRDQGDNNYVH